MQKIKWIFLLAVFFAYINSATGQDSFTGNWELNYPLDINHPNMHLSLQIGLSERNILYPAQLVMECEGFKATYELLLIKKNTRQLSISTNKFPVSEVPFSLGNWTIYLNGILDLSKDLKGNSLLTANRIVAKKYGIPLPESDQYEVPYKKTATLIRDFLRDAPIVLKKSSVAPWQDTSQYRLLDPRLSPAYFGILDTLHVHTKEGVIQFVNNKDIDIVSLKLNGKSVLDQIDSKKKRAEEDILLDTGLNIMTFFADDYGNNPPSTAAINLTFGKKNISLDFAAKQNLASTCIILKIYYDEDPAKNTKFQSNSFDGNFETATSQNNYNKLNNKSKAQLSRQTKILGDLVSSSKQIVLAIWDDAVEDGDSISISVNGEWITQGFAVKKKPQFLNIFLAPGPNQITFVADNLGSIVPNTAVLEIIDGKKRKSFNIETDMDINNKVKIFYDINQ